MSSAPHFSRASRSRAGNSIDGDYSLRAQKIGTLDREQTYRTAPPNGNGVAGLNVAIFCSHVSRRKYVRQKQNLFIRQFGGIPSGPISANGTRAILRLPARITADHMRITIQCRRRITIQLFRHPGIGIGVVAEDNNARAKEALAARYRKWNDHAIAVPQTPDFRPNSTTSPMNSWPRISPDFMVGM